MVHLHTLRRHCRLDGAHGDDVNHQISEYFRRKDGVLMHRGPNGRVRVATLDESAQYTARRRWWRRKRTNP
jgi:hypothetical protein